MQEQPTNQPQSPYVPYIVGFVLSLIITLAAYFLVVNKVLPAAWLLATILVLAFIQFVVQVVFFLHLGRESRPRWNLLSFSFMVMVVAIVVIGSIWIMSNLDYHHASSGQEVDKAIIEDEGIKQ